MNKKTLKNRLNSEIAELTPDALDAVVNSSYIEKPVVREKGAAKRRPSRRLTAVAISCCALLLVAGIGLAVYFATDRDVKPVSNAAYVTMSIEKNDVGAAAAELTENPSVSLTADSAEKVETVRADNEGGKQLLMRADVDIKGKSLAEAARLIAEAAARLGYIDVTATAATADAQISIKIAGTADVKLNDIKANIKSSVESYLKQNGIYAFVSDTAYTVAELVDEISSFDATVSLDAGIGELTAKLAARKPYYEERAEVTGNTDIGLLAEYAKVAIDCINEFASDYQLNYPLFKSQFETLKEMIDNMLEIIPDIADLSTIPDFKKEAIDAAKAMVVSAINTVLSIIPEDIATIIGEYIAEVPDTVEELGEYLDAVVGRRSERLYNQYKIAYESAREVISDEAYYDFTLKFSK